MSTGAYLTGRTSMGWFGTLASLFLIILTAPAAGQSTPTQVIPGTWAIEPYWPALQTASESQRQAALGDFLESVDDPMNDPERLNIERAVALTLYFQDHAPDLPCELIVDEWQQLALPQQDIDSVTPSLQSLVGCFGSGVVDPEDESERPIWTPFRLPGFWCEDDNNDGWCDEWFSLWDKPEVDPPPGCNWYCQSWTTGENGELQCIRWELRTLDDSMACPNPAQKDWIDPQVSGGDGDDGDGGSGGGWGGGSQGGGDGDDGGWGGGDSGGGGGSGSTDGSVTQGATGEESQDSDLERHATGAKTCNPVLVSDGFKVEKEVDFVVPLVGRDFKLYRTYNGSHILRNDHFPWAMGSGWGTSADGWIRYWVRGPYGGNQSCLGDRIDLTIFPLEHSTQYLDPDLDRPLGEEAPYLAPIGPGDSRFRRSTRVIDDESVGVWVLESPGQGHTVFVRAPEPSDPMHELDGRIIEQRDEYDNVWAYEYEPFVYPSGSAGQPRLRRILLGGENPETAEATVHFYWHTGDTTTPGTGKLRKVEVARRYQFNENGVLKTQTLITNRVEYTYTEQLKAQDLADLGEDQFDHLWSGRLDDPVLVKLSTLLNAPTLAADVSERPAPAEPVYMTQFWHYRYSALDPGSKISTLDYVFEPAMVEQLASHLGCALEEAAERLLLADLSDSIEGTTLTPSDFCSKAISYYTAQDGGDGYSSGELAGRVQRQVLRSGCSCSGGNELTFSQHFRYARRVIPMDEWEISQLITVYPTRESRLTERTDATWTGQGSSDIFDAGNWEPIKTARSWSEEFVIARGSMSNASHTWYSWHAITAPFVVADEIVDEASGTSARSVHVFETNRDEPGAFQRILRFHSDSIAGFDTYGANDDFAEGLLVLDAGTGETAHDAIDWNQSNTGGDVQSGLVEWWVYDDFSRMTDYGLCIGWPAGGTSGFGKPSINPPLPEQALRLKHHAYVAGNPVGSHAAPYPLWYSRSDLLTETTEYFGPGQSITKSFEYRYHDQQWSSSTSDDGHFLYPRVSLQVTTTSREDADENGPGGDLHSWRVFGDNGQVLYDLDEAGTATRYQYEPLTGERIATTRNDKSLVLASIPDGQSQGSAPAPGYDSSANNTDGSLTSAVTYDLMARPIETISETGIQREYEYRLGELPPDTQRHNGSGLEGYGWNTPCLMVVEYPHQLDDGSFDGPITIQWADARFNLLRVSTYQADVGVSFDEDHGYPDGTEIERSRAVHAYSRSGLLEQSIGFPLLTADLLNGTQPGDHALVSRFEYDAAGRLTTAISPDGVHTMTDFDGLGRPIAKRLSRPDADVDARTYSWLFYDTVFDSQGAENGDAEGKPSLVISLIDDLDANERNDNEVYRSARTIYDWRGRPRLTFTLATSDWPTATNWNLAADGTYQVAVLDDLDRPTDVFAISGGDMAALVEAITDGSIDATWVMTNLGPRITSHIRNHYSVRGLAYRVEEKVDPTTTQDQRYLRTTSWYDELGRVLLSLGPNGPVTRWYFDRLGRVFQTDVRDGSEARAANAGFLSVIEGDDEVVFERSTTSFDGATGLPWLITSSRRRHDATADGLDTNAVTTYVGTTHDSAARPIGTVDFGVNTNGADADVFRSGGYTPSAADIESALAGTYGRPTRNSQTGYDEIGRAYRVVDPEGVVSVSLFDDMNRAIGSVANAVGFESGAIHLQWNGATGLWQPSSEPAAVDEDRLTTVVYDTGGREHLKVAHVGTPGAPIAWKDQVTEFVHDPVSRTVPFDDLLENRAELPGPLFEIRYPDRGSGAPGAYASGISDRNDAVRHGYNLAGEQIATENQNHTIRTFLRDVTGRLLEDEVLGTNFGRLKRHTGAAGGDDDVDDWADTIETEYDPFGRVTAVRTWDGPNLRNEVTYAYDPRGRLSRLQQDCDEGVTGSSPAINYVYDTSESTNEDRLASVEYPDGTIVATDYGPVDGVDDKIDRVSGLSVDSTSLVEYQHLGLGTVAITDLITPGIQSDRTVDEDGSRRFGTITSGAEGRYPGWDRFGRLRLMSWVDVDHDDDSNSSYPTNLPVAQWRFEWSPAGDLLKKQDARPGAAWGDRDRLNAYDDLHRLEQSRVGGFADFEQDLLADAPNKSEHWALDSIGNWTSLQIDADGDGAFGGANDAEHARVHNAANEFEFDSDGATAEARFYDDSGSLGLIKLDGQQRNRFIYDAWNRLVEVKDGDNQRVVRYEYNGLHWRTIAAHYAGGTLDSRERFLYSPDWQLLEQRTYDASDDPTAIAQQFWGKRGADDAVARRVDRGDGSGGLPDGDYADAGDGTWYYVTDNLRSVSAVVDAAGSLVERVVYGPFGKSQHHFAGDVDGDGAADFFDVQAEQASAQSGAQPHIGDATYQAEQDVNRDGIVDFFDLQLVLADVGKTASGISHSLAAGGPGNPIGYAGYLYINDFGGSSGDFGPEGHWYARHRFYDPIAGRWITRDPAGYVDGMSLYLYVGGNPFGLVDPLGLMGDPPSEGTTAADYQDRPNFRYDTSDYDGGDNSARRFFDAIDVKRNQVHRHFYDGDGSHEFTLVIDGGDDVSGYNADQITANRQFRDTAAKIGKTLRVAGETLTDLTGAGVVLDVSQAIEDPSLVNGLAVVPVVGVVGDAAQGAKRVKRFADSGSKATGQIHHAISRKVHRALESHPNLKGLYEYRDARFVYRGRDLDAHRGYQRWHREYDKEVDTWLKHPDNANATQEDFEQFIEDIYNRPDLKERFPDGNCGQ